MSLPVEMLRSPGFLLNQTARVIKNRVAEALEPLSLEPQQYGLMRIISLRGPVNQNTFGLHYHIDRSSVVEIVDSLEKRGLVVRQKDPLDRRCNLLHLTPSGNKTLKKATKLVSRAQEDFLSPLSEEEWIAVSDCLARLL